MKTVEINKDRIDENEPEEKILSFEELEATVESLILPCCEFYQSNERTRENHRKCMAKCTAALSYITDFLKKYDRVETRPEFKTFDSVVCFQSLMFCLERYRPMGMSFMRMFVHVYFRLKKAHNRFLFDRMCRVNADIAYHEIRKAIRERLAEEGISGSEATELLHSFFSAETYLFATSRANFFKKKLHFSDNQIAEFEYTLRANGYVDSLDRIKENLRLKESEFSEFEDSLAPLERKAVSGGDEPEDEAEAFAETAQAEEDADKKPLGFEDDGQDFAERKESWDKLVNTAQKAYELAKNEREQTYLRCFLTLVLIKELHAETIPIQAQNEVLSGLATYIDEPFFRQHWKDDFSVAYREASEAADRQGKTIMESAFCKAARRKTMARHLGLAPSTIDTYCIKALDMMIQAGKQLYLVKEDLPSAVPSAESA